MIKIEANLPLRKKQYLMDFIEFSEDELKIHNSPEYIIQADRKGLTTTAAYNPNTQEITVSAENRALVDICRSAAHELQHHKQFETGTYQRELAKYDGKIPDIGHFIEDEANAVAGQLIKKFAKRVSPAIYEQDEKRLTPEVMANKLIAWWLKKGDIDLRDFYRWGIVNIFPDESEPAKEFLAYLTDKFMEHAGKEFNCEWKLVLPFDECDFLFNKFDCWSESSIAKILITTNFPLTSPSKDHGWSDFMFDSINDDNIKLLQSKTKIAHVDAEFLETEYPDLCVDLATDFYDIMKQTHRLNLRMHVVNEIKQVFHVAKNIQMVPDEKIFIITFDLTGLLNSKIFADSFKECLHRSFNSAMVGIVEEDNNIIELTNSAYFSLVLSGRRRITECMTELAGGSLPDFNCEEELDPGGSIDEELFNNEVTASIIKFFEHKY